MRHQTTHIRGILYVGHVARGEAVTARWETLTLRTHTILQGWDVFNDDYNSVFLSNYNNAGSSFVVFGKGRLRYTCTVVVRVFGGLNM